ncbi:hypothetical protein DSOL_4480 [Desulfosporosinus metallidurans]|uniref:Uncharacterized protein n=1 Tax=Desulfosporosinus metallidurans TaxID=1888891 RepID=A0A1Q8QJU7_9FIRM|nr:hypothetical protein DSOL_4480 [Desulfosporosinus metallidurans]
MSIFRGKKIRIVSFAILFPPFFFIGALKKGIKKAGYLPHRYNR